MDDQTAVGVDVDEPHTLPTAFVEGSREARLDSVIAQELHADTEFAAWLCERAGRDTKAGVDRVEVWLNRWQGDAEYPADAHGETDVYAIVHFSDGSHVPLFIEDKVTAPFQPRQAERYRWRADAVGGRTILIAPERYPVGDVVRQYFDGVVTVDMGRAKTDWRDIPLAEPRDTLHLAIREGVLSDPTTVTGPTAAPAT